MSPFLENSTFPEAPSMSTAPSEDTTGWAIFKRSVFSCDAGAHVPVGSEEELCTVPGFKGVIVTA